jgi:hypothetical protein
VNGIQARFSKGQVIRFYYAFNHGGPELRVARVMETFPGPSTTRNILCYDYTVNGVRSFRDYGMTGIRGFSLIRRWLLGLGLRKVAFWGM